MKMERLRVKWYHHDYTNLIQPETNFEPLGKVRYVSHVFKHKPRLILGIKS